MPRAGLRKKTRLQPAEQRGIKRQSRHEQEDGESGQWHRAYGNEMWEFNPDGLMARRYASINDAPIRADERRIFPPAR